VTQTSIQITGPPAGSQSWLITPFWDTPDGRVIDAGSGLRVSATVAAWTSTPGPPPTGILLQAIQASNVINGTCSVSIKVTWAPAPGATGYTVYNESGAISGRIPLTTFSFFYRQADMRLSDLGKAAVLAPISDYANSPEFTRGVQVKVAASFADRPDGLSAPVPLTFSIFPVHGRAELSLGPLIWFSNASPQLPCVPDPGLAMHRRTSRRPT
jgi:hypothetical protein